MATLRIVEDATFVQVRSARDETAISIQTHPVTVSQQVTGLQGPAGPAGIVTAEDPVTYTPATKTVGFSTAWTDPEDVVLIFENALA